MKAPSRFEKKEDWLFDGIAAFFISGAPSRKGIQPKRQYHCSKCSEHIFAANNLRFGFP